MFGKFTGVAVAVLAINPLSAFAQSVSECDWRASSEVLAEPWESNTRTFANGQIRVAVIDTVEPAAESFHLLVLSPPYDELGSRQCRIVSLEEGFGFAGFDLSQAVANYDPSRGLTVQAPVTIWSDGDQYYERWLAVTINSATGDVTGWVQ